MARAEEPSAAWSVSEHLLAIAANRLGELTYITAAVNSEEKDRKRMAPPEPILRPGEKPPERRHRGRRARIGPPIHPASVGGAPIETSAQEVS